MAINLLIRKVALEYSRRTGASLQETLEAMATAARKTIVQYSEKVECPFCLSLDIYIQYTVSAETEIKRGHKCRFCTVSFMSIEPTKVKKTKRATGAKTSKPKKKVAKRGKRKENKTRG